MNHIVAQPHPQRNSAGLCLTSRKIDAHLEEPRPLARKGARGINWERAFSLLLFVCLFPIALFGATTASGTIAYVQGNYATPQSPASTVSVPFSAAQTAGDLDVVVVGWNDSTATVKTVVDSKGNTYYLAVGPTIQTGTASQAIYYAKNIAAATAGANTVTVTFSTAANYADIRILEYSGADPSNPVDIAAASYGNSQTSTASATTTNPTDLIFGANLVGSVTTAPGSGFTQRLFTPDGDIAEDRMVTATGSYSATASLDKVEPWIMQMVAFRTPSSSSSTAALSAFSCVTSSMTGAGTDTCSVTLSAPASGTGFSVSLKSSSSAITVPASVTVAAGATTASFSATVASVTSAQSVTLSATSGSVTKTLAIQLNAAVATLTVSTSSLNFGSVAVNSSASQSITLSSTGTSAVTLNSATIAGTGFSISGASFPLTLSPSQSATLTVQFNPVSAGAISGALTIASNSSTNSSTVVSLGGTGLPVLTGLSCTNASMTGSGTDACTLTLNTSPPSGGFVVSLSSNNTSVTVPASVTVAAGASSASFSASVLSVTTAQAVTLSATAGGVARTYALQLNAAIPALTVSVSSMSFGSVAVNSTASQSITLSSTGTVAVTVNSATLSGSGFVISGVAFPLTLSPSQTATLQVGFDPVSAGAASSTLTIASNSSTNSTAAISLSGTGVPVVTGLSCANSSITGTATDACTVTLNAAAASGGFLVNLSSNNTAVTVPASITIPQGATSASFSATVSSVSAAQAATLSAVAGVSDPSFTLQLNAAIPTLAVNSSTLSFGNVAVNTPTSQSITLSSTGNVAVTINSATLAGTGFSISGLTFPLTLNSGQTATLSVQFDPTAAGAASGTLTIASNSSTNAPTTVNLSGTGVPVLSAVSCATSSITGSGTDACSVTLNTAAASSGFVVSLASTNSSVTVPASVTVAAGATSASFSATVSSVSSAQSVTLSASVGSTTQAFVLQLNAAVPTLSVSSSNLSFGNIPVNTSSSQSITLSSTGTAAVTVNSATLTGAGFSISGATFPLTLSPSQTATLTVQFDPTAAGAASGTLNIASNSSTNASVALSLSGTGMPVLAGLSCSPTSLSAASSSACTVTFNQAAPAGGSSVTLSSSNTALTVPASVTIPAGSTSVTFSASAGAFSANQTVTVTATFNGASVSSAINLAASTTITYVQGNYATPQGTASVVSVPYSTAQAAGDLDVVVVGWNDSTATVKTVVDSKGNTYYLAVGPTIQTGTASLAIFYAKNIAAASAGANTVTVTFSTAAVYPDIRVLEYSGADPTNPVDIAAASYGNSQTSTASATTTNPTDLIFGANLVGSVTTAPGSGFTQRLFTPDGDIAEDQMVTAAGSYSATASLDKVEPWIMQMVAFRTPAGSSTAQSAALSALSCATASITGAVADACSVTLSAPAPGTGFSVSLNSSSSAITVPASVTVAAGATTASFSATAVSVTTPQAVTLSATAGTMSQIFALQLSPALPALTVNTTSIAFGTVDLNTSSTQSVTLTSTGSASVTVSSATVTGAGFSVSGATFPLTLSPNQTATLSVQFDPTAAGATTGELTITSNASVNGTAAVSLSGAGQAGSYQVNLTWNPPTANSDPVAAYNVYRSASGSSSYQLVASVASAQYAFMDSNVQSGQTYDYVVESVDASGNESVPSNMASVSVP